MAEIDRSAFKSYDIRGTYPDQLDERFAYLLGRALPSVLTLDSARDEPARRVAVGHDSRLSSPSLYAALAAGLREAGAEVSGMGMCPTELVYFVAGSDRGLAPSAAEGFDLGVMITASHNPPEYNGFKVVKSTGESVSGAMGLDAVRRTMETLEGDAPPDCVPPEKTVSAEDDYLDFGLDLVGTPDASGLRIVVDAGNGVAGLLWDCASRRFGLAPIRMNFEPDGHFPAHHPDPSLPENVEPLVRRVQEEGADLGFSYDGDADRVVVVLGDGHVVDGSEMIVCMADRLMAADPRLEFGIDQTASRKALDYFRDRGIEPVITPVGDAKVRGVMRASPAMAFAGEASGHYYFPEFFCCDSSLITTLHILHLASSGRIGELVASLPGPWVQPAKAPRFEFPEQAHALDVCHRVAVAALDQYGDPLEVTCEVEGRVLRHCGRDDVEGADAVRVDYADWWFCVRPSGTEPIARLAVEARSPDSLAEKVGMLCCLFDTLT